ncbi:MAG: thioredoxin family protein [Bacteroidia bacterium]
MMLQIGDKLPDFDLLGYDDLKHSQYNYADKYALAVVFTCNSSAISRAYSNRLIKLFSKYEDDNLAIVGICSNDASQSPKDSFDEMKKAAKKLGLDNMHFDFLLDETQEIAKKFGATVTPEVFLFNRKRELVYKGAIDDNWQNEGGVTRVYLEDAIEAALDGIEVDYPEIPAVGDPIIWKK